MVVSLDRWRGKVAVVTGASAGMGVAIVQQLVEAGLQVVGLARRSERIEELAKKLSGKKGKLYAYKTDISNEEDILNAFKWIKSNVGPVSILINNAGILQNTELIDGDTAKWKMILDTNVLGLCIATREAISVMKANGIDGHIVHINSIAGHMVPNMPNFNVYAASKHAVTALTETLRLEFNRIGSKIKITSISPGAVRTDIFQAADISIPNEMVDHFPELNCEDIADAVSYVLGTPPHVQIHELIIKPVGEIL